MFEALLGAATVTDETTDEELAELGDQLDAVYGSMPMIMFSLEPSPKSITFNSNGGTAVEAQTGDTITVPAAPTYTGYTFGGWYDNQAFTTSSNLTPGARGVAVTQSKTVYAKWTNEAGMTVVTTPLDFTDSPVIPAGSGITWNSTTKTLTLSDAIIDCLAVTDSQFAVKLPDGAKLVPADDTQNTVKGGYDVIDDQNMMLSSAIFFVGDGEIIGNGVLQANSADVEGDENQVVSIAIYLHSYNDTLTIGAINASPYIIATAGLATNSALGSATSNGVSRAEIVNGSLTAIGGTANAYSGGADSLGIDVAGIYGGMLFADGGTATGGIVQSYGVLHLVPVSGDTVQATGNNAAIMVIDGASADIIIAGNAGYGVDTGDLTEASIVGTQVKVGAEPAVEAKTAMAGFPTVEISPYEASVAKDRTKEFSARVVDLRTGQPGGLTQSVTWSLEGSYATGTTLSAVGVLTIAAGETASTLNVRATSTAYPQRYDDAVVTVITGGGGNNGGGATTPTTPTTPPTNIVVNGNNDLGKVETSGNTSTMVVDKAKLDTALSTAGSGSNVQVDIPATGGTATAQLVVENVEDMAKKEVTLTIKTGDVTYHTTAIDIAGIMSELGATNPTDVPVNLTITMIDTVASDNLKEQLKGSGLQLIGTPIQFEVTATFGGKTAVVDRFTKMIERVVEIAADQAKKITTAAVIENDGTNRHVPTFVYNNGGKWFAKVNSRTNLTYAFISNGASFTDAAGKWYEGVVNEMASRKVINGKTETTFDGGASITRAEFASIIVRALGLPSDGTADFTDISKNAWYAGAVGTAVEYGLVTGYADGTFAPNANITRLEAMAMMQRAAAVAEYPGKTGSIDSFADAGSVAKWAKSTAAFNVGSGLIEGSSGNICPNAQITRAECATVVLRLLQNSDLIDKRTEV